jgi:hypothetical protein
MMTSYSSLRRFAVASTLIAVSVLVRAPGTCWAQDRKTLIQMGNSQRKAGDDLGALGSFLRAHALAPTPESFAQIGMCEFVLNRFVDAEIHLAEAMKSPQDAWIRKNHVALQEYVASTKAMLGWIEVVGTPAGAEVEVGGRPVGRLPLPGRIRVAVGEVNVRMDAPGFRVNRQDVEVTADQIRRLNIDLVPLSANVAANGPPPPRMGAPGSRRHASDPALGIDGDVTAGNGPGSGSVGAGSPYRMAGWITAGAGAVLLGTGVVALFFRESNTQQFNDYEKDGKRCNEAIKGNGGSACTTYLDRSHTATVVAYGAFASAALAGVVSAILLSANPADQAIGQLSPAAGAQLASARAGTRAGRLRCVPNTLQLGGACSLTF